MVGIDTGSPTTFALHVHFQEKEIGPFDDVFQNGDPSAPPAPPSPPPLLPSSTTTDAAATATQTQGKLLSANEGSTDAGVGKVLRGPDKYLHARLGSPVGTRKNNIRVTTSTVPPPLQTPPPARATPKPTTLTPPEYDDRGLGDKDDEDGDNDDQTGSGAAIAVAAWSKNITNSKCLTQRSRRHCSRGRHRGYREPPTRRRRPPIGGKLQDNL